jgi:hypothetical protein
VGESEHDAEEQVEDLDVPESEREEVKGGAVDAFQKVTPTADKQLGGNTSWKLNPGGLNFGKG